MKAAVVLGPNQTPIYSDFASPAPRDGFESVTVSASALSNATRGRAAGAHYTSTDAFPFVPGIDGVGRTGSGQRVAFLLPEAPFGGLAEQTLVRTARCIPVPDDVTDTLAAAIINPGLSSMAALRERAALQRGETVLINGATGTAGLLAVQIAKHLGAGRVIATGRNAPALARALKLGADDTIDLSPGGQTVQDALADRFTTGDGVDVVLDYLSGAPAEAILSAIARSYKEAKPIRYVVSGGSAGRAITVPASTLASSPLVLMGNGIGSVRMPGLIRAAADAVQIIASAGLQIDFTEVPLPLVEEAWNRDYGRSRIVFTIS